MLFETDIDTIIARRIRTLDMLTDAQRAQVRECWTGLNMSDDDRRRWFVEVDAQGFTRLARIAMGEGKLVLHEMAALRESVYA